MRKLICGMVVFGAMIGICAAQDSKPADMSKPVKVFILMGQSNMVGAGNVSGGDGSLEYAVHTKKKYPYLVNAEGKWTERADVRYAQMMQSKGLRANDWMTVKSGKIGPEIGIGHALGDALDEPVLILKSCIGNRSLGWDILPPGSKGFDFTAKDGKVYTYAGYKESPMRWEKGTTPTPIEWYAGKNYDDDTADAKQVLSDIGKYYPGAQKYEVAGFVWWQGDKDRYDDALAEHYEQNLVQLIKHLREDFNAPQAKFVLATLGQTKKGDGGNDGKILDGQLAVDGASGKYPEFNGNVATVYANPLSLGGASNSHYNNNAETYMNVGEALGAAMVKLLKQKSSSSELRSRGVDKIAFVKRKTYTANHYYTEYLNSKYLPGGGIFVLDLNDGSEKNLASELQGGVFERMDLNFDATKVAFAWKKSEQEGYRLYEVNIDGTGLHQLIPTPSNEAALISAYEKEGYHHGTDDMSPCYLPDGGIAFVSTRCQYGILCNSPGYFTTTVIYRCDADGSNVRKLTNSSVSEASPSCTADGQILYTRWEYVDKGAVSAKCLWSMRPDGTNSQEVYGNDISLPPTFIYGRDIPGESNLYVFTGTPHYPQSGMGTIILADTKKNIRTRDVMTYVTPYTDITDEGGWDFLDEKGEWYNDNKGSGPLFKEAFPLSKELFIVSHKPAGGVYTKPNGYGIYLLDSKGVATEIFRDSVYSCWCPIPVVERPVPPVLQSPLDSTLEEQGLAQCIVTDIYHGLENVERGQVKYIRVLEQIPRPWSARRPDDDDLYDQQHACITKDTALGLKVQHGVVPVESDGSASFLVPTERNIFFQALDENYMSLQTERTYVNYMPGEVRSCVGCHELPNTIPTTTIEKPKVAFSTVPQLPGPQPGETSGQRVIDYAQDVQPVWDRHCLNCHSDEPGKKIEGNLNLSGKMTTWFNTSYEELVPERRKEIKERGLLGQVIGENHPKTGNVHYLPAGSLGARTSVLVAILAPDKVRLSDPVQQKRAESLAESHKEIKLSREELLRVTNWVDTNCQYYGSYFGRRNTKYEGTSDFRPFQTFEMATDKREIPLEK